MLLSRINRSATSLLKVAASQLDGFSFRVISSATNDSSLDHEYGISEHHQSSKQDTSETIKKIPLSIEEFKKLRSMKPCQPDNPHRLKVSILGEPNAGKSTLTNSLVKWRVCSVSRKVHTTRKKASAILVEDNKQIIFLDTPGYVSPEMTKKHNLEPSFVMDPLHSITYADIIAVVVDAANKWTNNRIHEDIWDVLQTHKDKKSILILNKVDAVKTKTKLLGITRKLSGGTKTIDVTQNTPENEFLVFNDKSALTKDDPPTKDTELEEDTSDDFSDGGERKHAGWRSFSEVFMVSALKGNGVEALRNYLLSEAKPHEWTYHDSMITDQHPHEIALTTVREKLLDYLPEEIPYVLDLSISKWELLSSGSPKIDILIKCTNNRHRRFVIGPAGKHIAACVERSRLAMREAFRKDVVLHIAVV